MVAAAQDEAVWPVKLGGEPCLVHLRTGRLAHHLAALALAQRGEEETIGKA